MGILKPLEQIGKYNKIILELLDNTTFYSLSFIIFGKQNGRLLYEK
jgi:hypothetical protein